MSDKKGYIPKDQRKKILFLADDMRVTSGVGLGLVDALGLGGFGDKLLAEKFGDAQCGHLLFQRLEFGHLGVEAGGVGLDVVRLVAGLHGDGVVDAHRCGTGCVVPAL